jgi:hypothetical protein
MIPYFYMKNKIVAGVLLGLILVGGGIGLWLKLGSNNQKKVVVEENKMVEPTVTEVISNKTWKDEAGFEFEYSGGLTIKQDTSDQNRYTNLTITSEKTEAKILILAEDTTYKTVADWIKNDKKLKGASATDIDVGGKSGKKVVFADSEKVEVGVIEDNILFSIELDNGKDEVMASALETITGSFEFVVPTQTQKTTTDTGQDQGGEVIEEETIIE